MRDREQETETETARRARERAGASERASVCVCEREKERVRERESTTLTQESDVVRRVQRPTCRCGPTSALTGQSRPDYGHISSNFGAKGISNLLIYPLLAPRVAVV